MLFGMLHLIVCWMFHGEVVIGLIELSDQLVRFNVGYEF